MNKVSSTETIDGANLNDQTKFRLSVRLKSILTNKLNKES